MSLDEGAEAGVAQDVQSCETRPGILTALRRQIDSRLLDNFSGKMLSKPGFFNNGVMKLSCMMTAIASFERMVEDG